MRKKLKKLLSMSIATLVIISTLNSSMVYAAEESNESQKIQSVEELAMAVEMAQADGEITEIEKNDILSNTPLEVAIAYVASLQEEVKQVLETENYSVAAAYSSETLDEDTISSNTYYINDAVSVIVDITDVAENTITTRGATVTEGGASKALGDRKTTGTYKETFLGITLAELKLTLGYTVNSSNMTTRYASTSGSTVSVGSVSTSTEITDDEAAKVGHDMNCNGSYDISIAGYAGLNIGLTLSVKWERNIDSQTRYIRWKLDTI